MNDPPDDIIYEICGHIDNLTDFNNASLVYPQINTFCAQQKKWLEEISQIDSSPDYIFGLNQFIIQHCQERNFQSLLKRLLEKYYFPIISESELAKLLISVTGGGNVAGAINRFKNEMSHLIVFNNIFYRHKNSLLFSDRNEYNYVLYNFLVDLLGEDILEELDEDYLIKQLEKALGWEDEIEFEYGDYDGEFIVE